MSPNPTGLQELSPGGIWIGERKLWFGGVHLRSRMTVIRLAGGKLWVHSASEPTPELCRSSSSWSPTLIPSRIGRVEQLEEAWRFVR